MVLLTWTWMRLSFVDQIVLTIVLRVEVSRSFTVILPCCRTSPNKRIFAKKKKKKAQKSMNSYHCQWPHLIACNMLSLCHIRTSNTTLSFPSMQRVGFSLHKSRRQLCSGVFSHFALLFPLEGEKKHMRWYLGYRRLWGRAPASTRVPGVSGGRDIMTCQAASHHTGLPARQRSTTTSVYIIDGMTNGSLGRMRSEQL